MQTTFKVVLEDRKTGQWTSAITTLYPQLELTLMYSLNVVTKPNISNVGFGVYIYPTIKDTLLFINANLRLLSCVRHQKSILILLGFAYGIQPARFMDMDTLAANLPTQINTAVDSALMASAFIPTQVLGVVDYDHKQKLNRLYLPLLRRGSYVVKM